MLEIAVRSDTRMGSLYRFFPNKETLAIRLMSRFQEKIDILFNEMDDKSLSLPDLGDRILAALIELDGEGSAIARLLEIESDGSSRREEFRTAVIDRIAMSLKRRAPGLGSRQACDMAFVILRNMRDMWAISKLKDKRIRSGAIKELRRMNRLYLKNRLKDR